MLAAYVPTVALRYMNKTTGLSGVVQQPEVKYTDCPPSHKQRENQKNHEAAHVGGSEVVHPILIE